MGSSQKYLRLLVLMSSNAISTPERWFACARLLDSYLTGHMDPPFLPTLTTTVFSQCRSGRFEASPCRRTSEGHNSSITSVASRTSQMSTPHLIRIAAAHANTRGSQQPFTRPVARIRVVSKTRPSTSMESKFSKCRIADMLSQSSICVLDASANCCCSKSLSCYQARHRCQA
jgi:hypothetical protein